MLKLIRRLFSLAVSRSLLRRSSLVRRLFSLTLSRSLSSCSSVKFRLLSLLLSCSLSRCSSVKLRLSSLFLSLSHFLCLSLSLYSKLEDIINKISRIAELRGAQPIRKISFSSELISLKFLVVYASRNAGGLLFSRQKLCTHRLPEILHWFACGADGRSVARSVGHVITKFSGMGRFIYPWCSAGALRARSSANNNDNNSINQLSQKIVPESFDAFFLNLCNFKNFKSRRMSTDHNKITFATKYLRMSQVR